jgi:hypothetical protein
LERAGIKPYSFADQRAADLMRLAPTLPDTADGRRMLIAVANYMTGNSAGFKVWIDQAAAWYFEDDADELIARLARKPYRYKSATLATLFNVTTERKHQLGITTIAAYDTPKDVIEAKRDRKRRYDQRYREGQRRRLGMTPRAQYEAESISRLEPWKAAGFNTRRTWERQGKPGPGSRVASVSFVDLLSSTSNDRFATRVAKPRRSRPKRPKTPSITTKPSKRNRRRGTAALARQEVMTFRLAPHRTFNVVGSIGMPDQAMACRRPSPSALARQASRSTWWHRPGR